MPERAVQSFVKEAAARFGWLYYHTRDSRGSDPGFPDCCLVRGERLIFAELKSTKGRTSPAQAEWLERLRGCGIEVYLWRPADLDEIIAKLR